MSKFFRSSIAIASLVALAGLCNVSAAQDVFPFTDGDEPGSGPGGDDGWEETAIVYPIYTITEILPIGSGLESFCTGISNNGWVVGGAKINSTSSAATHAFRTREGMPVVDLGTLPGLPFSSAYAVNNAGDVVGVAAAAANLYGSTAKPFIVRNGTWTNLDTMNLGIHASANAINSSGLVVGVNSFLGTGSVESFKWQSGAPVNLPDLPNDTCRISYGQGVNDFGVVVGYSAAPGRCGDNRAVKYDGNTVIDLGTLGGPNAQANSINNLNQVVGYSETQVGQNRATMWHNGTITNLGTLAGASFALSINNDSNVVGYFIDNRNQQRACAWLNGNMVDLNTLMANGTGWRLLIATGINDSGQIVGQARNPQGRLRGFVLTPPCRSDYNRDGGIDGSDVSNFIMNWENAQADTDINYDGGIDGLDVQEFFELWEASRC